MLTATAADGTNVVATDEGRGPAILVLHGGLDDGASWAAVAARLAPRYRVIRLHRRRYRLELDTRAPCSIAQEVEHVVALARALGEPALLVGHSSGAVLALEALLVAPALFRGAVLYEPPVVIGPSLGGASNAAAQAAVAAGQMTRAIAIFFRDMVKVPPWVAWAGGAFVAMHPRMKRFIPRQIEDNVAIDALGVRLDAYAQIAVPVVLLGGARSPSHLAERLDALERTLPDATRVVMARQGHGANARAPDEVARVIEAHAQRVLRATDAT